jgi:hypothetical protein
VDRNERLINPQCPRDLDGEVSPREFGAPRERAHDVRLKASSGDQTGLAGQGRQPLTWAITEIDEDRLAIGPRGLLRRGGLDGDRLPSQCRGEQLQSLKPR